MTQETPQQAIECIVTAVLDEVFQANNIPAAIRTRAQELTKKFKYSDTTYLGPQARRAAGREYDTWIDEIFRATQSGEWMEDLLRNFIHKLALFMEQDRTDALFAMVVEEITAEQKFVRYLLAEYLGIDINKKHWHNFATKLEQRFPNPFPA